MVMNLGAITSATVPDDQAMIIEVGQDDSDRVVTFGEARAAFAAIGRGLLARGLARGDRVAIVAGNSANYLLAYMGIMQAGMCAVPVNHKLPQVTIDHVLTDSEIRFGLVDAAREPMLAGKVPVMPIEEERGFRELFDPGPLDPVDMAEGDFANILYTSGSTGLPKGVPLTHGGYVWSTAVYADSGAAMAGKRLLAAAPLYHMNALFQSKLTMRFGATLVLMKEFSAAGYLRAIDRHRVNIITSVPTMLALVAREVETLATVDLSSVDTVMTGSAPSTTDLVARIQALFPNAAPMTNGYGTTESGPVAFGPHPDGLPRPVLALGYPRSGVEVRLVDGPDENEGTLWIRNSAIMPGYLNRPEATEKRLKDGWYDTGDVMRRDENGFFFFVGRADDMFTCAGENIYPGEVEKMLEGHPDVAQAAVVPVPDEIKHKLPVAFVVARPGHAVDEASVKQYALANGPAYAHPRAVWVVDQLPLSGTNKVDRTFLVRDAEARFVRG